MLDRGHHNADSPNSPYFEGEDCPECEGDGYTITSCCGNDMKPYEDETDLCPTCFEHQGMEHEDCENCNGTGTVTKK